MPGGIRLNKRAAADIATPPADKVTLYFDDTDGPGFVDETATFHGIEGTPGTPGADGADAPPLAYSNHGNTGSTETVDWSAGDIQRLVANAATVTLSYSNVPSSGTPGVIQLWLEQDGTGGRDWVFPAATDWGDFGEPDWTTRGAGHIDLVTLETVDGGTVVVAGLQGRPGPQGDPGVDGADGADGADGTGSGTLTTIEEVDGTPSDSAVTKLVVPNGTLAIASHVATLDIGNLLPWHVSIVPMIWTPDAATGTWVISGGHTDSAKAFPFYVPGSVANSGGAADVINSSAAQNDAIAWDVILGAGTWDAHFWVRASTNTGIITLNKDAVSQGTVDTYAAAAAASKLSITGWTVSTTGKKRMQILLATKNASSSGYGLTLFAVEFRRTA